MGLYVPKTQVINGTGGGAVAITMSVYAPTVVGVDPPAPPEWAESIPYDSYDAGWMDIDMSSDGTKIAVGGSSNGKRLEYSSDSGATFTDISPIADREYACVNISSDGTKIFTSTRTYTDQLQISTNSGASFTGVGPGTGIDWSTTMSSDGSTLVAAGYNNRLYTSTNNGSSWTERQPEGAVNKHWRKPAISSDGQTILVGQQTTLGKLWLSTNGGTSWAETVPVGTTNSYIYSWMSPDGSVLISQISISGIGTRQYISSNGGSTWSETTPQGVGENPQTYTGTSAFDFNTDGTLIYAACMSSTTQTLQTSTNYGVSWTDLDPVGSPFRINGVAASTDGTKIIIGSPYTTGDFNGGYVSSDSGSTFTRAPALQRFNQDWADVTISADGSTMIVSSYDILNISTDGGSNWTETNPPNLSGGDWFCQAMSSDAGVMYVSGYGTRVWKSTNGGTSWTEIRPDGDRDGDWPSLRTSSDGSVVLVGEEGGRLWLSSNGGTSFSELTPAGSVNADWYGLALSDDGQSILAGGWGMRLWYSSNQGSSFVETRPAGDVDSDWVSPMLSADGGVMTVGDYERVYKSTNGTSWTEMQPQGAVTDSWDACAISGDGQTMICSGDGNPGLWVSTDEGATWAENSPNNLTEGAFYSVDVSDGGIIINGRWDGRLEIYS